MKELIKNDLVLDKYLLYKLDIHSYNIVKHLNAYNGKAQECLGHYFGNVLI